MTEEKTKSQKQKVPTKKYYTVTEISKYLNVTEGWVYKLKTANKIPFTQIEGKILFDIDKINEWLNGKSSSPKNG